MFRKLINFLSKVPSGRPPPGGSKRVILGRGKKGPFWAFLGLFAPFGVILGLFGLFWAFLRPIGTGLIPPLE